MAFTIIGHGKADLVWGLDNMRVDLSTAVCLFTFFRHLLILHFFHPYQVK